MILQPVSGKTEGKGMNMTGLFHRKYKRREFLTSVGRYLMMTGLISTVVALLMRRKSASAADRSTDIRACQKCTFLRRCEQPIATQARKVMIEQ